MPKWAKKLQKHPTDTLSILERLSCVFGEERLLGVESPESLGNTGFLESATRQNQYINLSTMWGQQIALT